MIRNAILIYGSPRKKTYICYEIYIQIVCVRPVVIRRKRRAQMDTKQPYGVRANLETKQD